MSDSVDDYIASALPEVQDVLQRIRETVHEALPGAGERLSYRMPTITVDDRPVIHFAAWKHHIAIYPAPDDDALVEELARYRTPKGTLRFPLDEPVPYELIGRVAVSLAGSR